MVHAELVDVLHASHEFTEGCWAAGDVVEWRQEKCLQQDLNVVRSSDGT